MRSVVARIGVAMLVLALGIACGVTVGTVGTAQGGGSMAASQVTGNADSQGTGSNGSGSGGTNAGGTSTGGANGGGTSTGGTSSNGSGSSPSDSKGDRWLAVAVLTFALLVIVAVLAYLYGADREYTTLAKLSVRRLGIVPPARDIPPLARQADRVDAVDAGAPPPVSIAGPSVLMIGAAQAYTASTQAGPVAADWTVTPEGLTIAPTHGETVQLTATKLGTYVLSATVTGQATPGRITVVALEAAKDSTGGAVPFIGAGYGTVLLAVVLVALATVLGLVGVLDGTALGTLLGAIVGYVFVRGASGGGSPASGGTSAQTGGGAGAS